MEVSLGLNCDINELLRQIGLDGKIDRTAVCSSDLDGGRFVSAMSNGLVLAAYYHPSRRHSATAIGGVFGPQTKSTVNPGKWAVAFVSKGKFGNKTFYNVF